MVLKKLKSSLTALPRFLKRVLQKRTLRLSRQNLRKLALRLHLSNQNSNYLGKMSEQTEIRNGLRFFI